VYSFATLLSEHNSLGGEAFVMGSFACITKIPERDRLSLLHDEWFRRTRLSSLSYPFHNFISQTKERTLTVQRLQQQPRYSIQPLNPSPSTPAPYQSQAHCHTVY
jgi:hypothetical protein